MLLGQHIAAGSVDGIHYLMDCHAHRKTNGVTGFSLHVEIE